MLIFGSQFAISSQRILYKDPSSILNSCRQRLKTQDSNCLGSLSVQFVFGQTLRSPGLQRTLTCIVLVIICIEDYKVVCSSHVNHILPTHSILYYPAIVSCCLCGPWRSNTFGHSFFLTSLFIVPKGMVYSMQLVS